MKFIAYRESRKGLSLTRAGKDAIWGYFFISPWIIGLIAFSALPILSAIYYGFTRYDIFTPPVWIGLANFKKMFTADPLFWKSLYNTAYYVCISVPLRLLLAFTLAMLLNSRIRGMAVYRSLVYLPMVVPIVAAAILASWILHPRIGVMNYLLSLLKIPAIRWMVTERWSKPAIVLVSLWRIGESMIIFLAGLQGIPTQLYEAAAIDGATPRIKLLRITIPMLTPVILFNLIIDIIHSFQVFAFAMIMTKGGPLNSSLFFVLYIYQQSFNFFHMGYACGLATVLFFIILGLTILVFRSSESWVYYEAEGR
jgi:multiple sugar transport system permease protein